MKYLGIARAENGMLRMPEGSPTALDATEYEVAEVGGILILSRTPFDRGASEEVLRHAESAIAEHRRSLEGLAR